MSVQEAMDHSNPGQHHTQNQEFQSNHTHENGNAIPPAKCELSLLQRIDHLTWAWFTLPMSTGGLALVVAAQPHQFRGLITIGTIIFICNIVIFTTLTTLIAIRFIRNPSALRASFRYTKESLFQPTFSIAIFTILGGIQQYGQPSTGPWLIVVIRVLFWIYTSLTVLGMLAQYYVLFAGQKLSSKTMTPALVLAVFPPMLSGTLASLIAANQPPHQRIPIIVAGVTLQGLGFLVSLLVNAAYMVRMLDAGFPPIPLRPSMFIAVGPPAFTSLALIGIANTVPVDYGYFKQYPAATSLIPPLALMFSIFIWTLGVWFLFMAIVGCVSARRQLKFQLVWYAFVFPNSGFVISVIALGNAMDSEGIKWVASALTIVLFLVFFFVVTMNVRSVVRREVLWPGKDEDA